MLHSFRSGSAGIAAKVLIAVIVVSMAFFGVEDMLKQRGLSKEAASIGNRRISQAELENALRRETEQLKARLAERYSPELVEAMGLKRQILQKMLNHEAFALEAAALGLMPDDAGVASAIRAEAVLQDEKGNFDKARFQRFLKTNGLTEKRFVEIKRAEMAIELLQNAILAAEPAPQIAAETIAAIQGEKRAANAYILKSSLVSDVPAPTEEHLRAYYEEHKDEYALPEYRRVSYVTLTPVNDDLPAPEDKLRAAYAERLKEFARPERRRVQQMLFAGEAKAREAHALLNSGKSFGEAAKLAGAPNLERLKVGDVTESMLPEIAKKEVFGLKEGGFTAPIQTPFGWHIFKVEKILPPDTMPFEEARERLERDMKLQYSTKAMTMAANQLEDGLAGGDTIEEAAKALGLTLHRTGLFDAQGESQSGGRAEGLPAFASFLEKAFKTAEGEDSGIVADDSGEYFLLHVDEVSPARPQPFEAVEARLRAGWENAERGKRLREMANEAAKAFKAPGTRRESIQSLKLTPVPVEAFAQGSPAYVGGKALPLPLVSELFGLKAGESTQAYPLGDDFIIAVMTERANAPPAPKEKVAQLQGVLSEQMQAELLQQYADYLNKKYDARIEASALQAEEDR